VKIYTTTTKPIEKLRAKTLLKAIPKQTLDLILDQKLLRKWQSGKKTMSMNSGQRIIWDILATRHPKKQNIEMAKKINVLYMKGPRGIDLWDSCSTILDDPCNFWIKDYLLSTDQIISQNKLKNPSYEYSPIDELPQAIRFWMCMLHNHKSQEPSLSHRERLKNYQNASYYLSYVLMKSEKELADNYVNANELLLCIKTQYVHLIALKKRREYKSPEHFNRMCKSLFPKSIEVEGEYQPLNNNEWVDVRNILDDL